MAPGLVQLKLKRPTQLVFADFIAARAISRNSAGSMPVVGFTSNGGWLWKVPIRISSAMRITS